MVLFDVFGDLIEGKQYDLIMAINGMVQAYLQWVLESPKQFDIHKLADSLVEKATILATHTKIVFLQQPLTDYRAVESFSNEKIVQELEQINVASFSCVEKESVELLIKELQNEQPRAAIVFGLLANLENHESFYWITLFLKKQFS